MIVYNDSDLYSARWLRNLMAAGLVPTGTVDERDIRELKGSDCGETTHFFAGIGGWPHALQLAGWPAGRPVWTGSCPCPPFSAAGKKQRCPACGGRPIPCPVRTGYFICLACEHAWHADGRHLWPEFWRLIRDCRPPVVFGEQVAGAAGRIWFAGVRATLERIGYAVGAADLAAAGIGAPHIRQRLFWVAESGGSERRQQNAEAGIGHANGADRRRQEAAGRLGIHCEVDGLADRYGEGHQGAWRSRANGAAEGNGPFAVDPLRDGSTRRQGSTDDARSREGTGAEWAGERPAHHRGISVDGVDDAEHRRFHQFADAAKPGSDGQEDGLPVTTSSWSDYIILLCRDGANRRTQSGLFPLVDGISFRLADGRTRENISRAAMLKGIGNAIVPQLAAEFIRAYMECRL